MVQCRVKAAFASAWPNATEPDLEQVAVQFAGSGCADPNYLKELGKGGADMAQFISRVWEAVLYARFVKDRWNVSGRGARPDFTLKKDQLTVLVEAVAAQPGDPQRSGMPAEWQGRSSKFFVNIYDEMIPRLTSALKTKTDNYQKYLQQNPDHKNPDRSTTPFVIAINDVRLRSAHGLYPPTSLPLIVHAVLPVGGYGMIEDVATGQEIVPWRLQWRAQVPKRNGKPVPTDIFLDQAYGCVSAVIYCWTLEARENGIVVVHNPRATNPLPRGLFPGVIEYVVKIESSNDAESFVIERVSPPEVPPRTF